MADKEKNVVEQGNDNNLNRNNVENSEKILESESCESASDTGQDIVNSHTCVSRSHESQTTDENNKTSQKQSSNESDSETDIHKQSQPIGNNERLEFENSDSQSESESESNYESAEEEQNIVDDEDDDAKEEEVTLSEEEKVERRTEAQNHKEEGNQCFREERFEDASQCYTKALKCCPKDFPRDRSIMFSNRAACKFRMDQNEESVKDCSSALELHPHYLKPLLRRAELYEKLDKLEEALADYQKAVELDPSQHSARAACMRLPDQIKERNEKLKEEMLGKLKDLGNMFLKPFGLSTDNFQMKKDENTGGYSVNFQQNVK